MEAAGGYEDSGEGSSGEGRRLGIFRWLFTTQLSRLKVEDHFFVLLLLLKVGTRKKNSSSRETRAKSFSF